MNVLLTGAAGSLGQFLVESLLRDGETVVGFDIDPAPEMFTKSLPSSQLDRWSHVCVDLTDAAAVATAIDQAAVIPDVIINNAGLLYSAPLLRFDQGRLQSHAASEWTKAVSVNLDAAFHVLSIGARRMAAAGKKGVIINISSISAHGNVGQAAYSAAKAGVNALTAVAAKELGPFGIRVAAIAPGFLDSASTRSAVTAETLARIRKAVPLGRLGKPENLYHAVRFVMENDYFHGKVLELDGGLTL